jgi:hypothetical protein
VLLLLPPPLLLLPAAVQLQQAPHQNLPQTVVLQVGLQLP